MRGRLVQTFTIGERLLATVFMLDYGLTLDRVDTVKFVRRIEDGFLSEAPLAFQVVLAGLSPVSMDLVECWRFHELDGGRVGGSVTVMSKHRSCPLVPAKGMSRSAGG